MIFFDTYGNPWITCSPRHRRAEAFGPRGAARRIEFGGYMEFSESGGGTPYNFAVEKKKVEVSNIDGWEVVTSPIEMAEDNEGYHLRIGRITDFGFFPALDELWSTADHENPSKEGWLEWVTTQPSEQLREEILQVLY